MQGDYDRFGFLMKDALNSWMAGEFPELSQTIEKGSHELYRRDENAAIYFYVPKYGTFAGRNKHEFYDIM